MPVILRKATFNVWQFAPWLFCMLYCAITVLRASQPLVFVPFAVSIILAFSLTFFLAGKLRSRTVHALLALLLLLPILLQMQSFHLSGELITVMALANIDSAKAVSINWKQVAPFVVLVVLSIATLALPVKHGGRLPKSLILGILGVYGILLVQNLRNDQIINQLDLPIFSLVTTVVDAEFTEGGVYLNAEDRAVLEKEFRKEVTYDPSQKYASLLSTFPSRPNFLVLFTEGMSARMMSAYGGSRPTLMPNMDRFYQEALVFDNYYNHTAATFRGLRGQLTSSFIGAREDGETGLAFVEDGELVDHTYRGNVISVPQILKSRGYDTAFLTPHSEEMNLNTFIKDIGFDQVITGTDVAKLQGHDQVPVGDKNLYQFLPDLTGKLKEPYFLGVYNFGTHLFQDSPDEKFGDGGSVVLNRFHNVDTQFGVFLKKFKTDPLFKNTVLILTADHAAYPAPEFTQVENVKPGYFIDRIPMMVYWNGVKHQRIDMAGRNSLSFAPTIMEMAKIRDAKNYFLGCSMFAEGCDISSYVTNINAFYFMTNTGQIRYLTENKADPDYTTARNSVERFVKYSGF